VGLASDIQR